jgi:chromate transport protein ChrA
VAIRHAALGGRVRQRIEETENTMTKDKKLLRLGSSGTAIAAICCFTPALVVLVGFAGLSAIVGWLDYGLFPVLFASMGLVAYALYLRSGRQGPSPTAPIVAAAVALSALLFWLEFRYALRISIAAALVVAAYGYYLRACLRRQTSPLADTKGTLS